MSDILPNGAPIAAIPLALRQRPQWVLWRNEPKRDKPDESTKMPYSDVGHKARSNDPKTWLSFAVALARWASNPSGWAGIGYVFSADDPYTGIDLDTCLNPANGQVAGWADAELALLLPTYAEVSPSGTGIKLFVETEHPHTLGSGDKTAGQIEVYSAGRFFAVTGQAFEDAPATIAHVDDTAIEQIIAREQARRQVRKPATPTPTERLTHTNGAHPPLGLPDLARALEQLHPDRWVTYDDWLRIGMALHHWAGSDAQRVATALALFDQYSKERAPAAYGEVAEKWASFGKRNGQAPDVTVGTLLRWASEDAPDAATDEPPHPADVSRSTEDDDPPPPHIPASSFPELPEVAQADEAIGADACPWLDAYIAFSRQWSPRSYDDFHEACGLWVLSTVAARRVMLPLGGERFTNLYVALCARTSLWAKSTAAKIAGETLRAAGLGQLLAPDNATPQAFIKDLTAVLPSEWENILPGLQAEYLERLAFAGQKGWFYEEYGEHLAAMMREGSAMADYRGHFRRFDDCPASYTYSTIGRGRNTVERPYLALLANLTPADLTPFARKGSSLWGDGYFARYAFVTPPQGAQRSRSRFPEGWRTIPATLAQPLRAWHVQLGIPEVDVAEQRDEKGHVTSQTLDITPAPPQRCTLGFGVYDAYYRYKDALDDLIDTGDNTDLDGSYSRFAEKALRIAMLLASFSNGGRIEIDHWARAQAIAERWRRSLHHLIDQIGQSDATPDRTRELKVMSILERRGALAARDVARFGNISTGEAQQVLDQLVKAGTVLVEPGKRTKRYRIVASVVSVVVSQPPYPAQSYDSSADTPGALEEVSYFFNTYDRNDYTTVTTVPPGDPAPPCGEPIDQDAINYDAVRQAMALGQEESVRAQCAAHGLDADTVIARALEMTV